MSFKKIGRIIVILLLVASGTSGGYYFGRRGFDIEVKKSPPRIEILNKTPSEQVVDFKLFWDVWDLLNNEHISRPLDGQKLLYGALKGLAEAVEDPYTSFLTPDQNEAVINALNSTYEGIGAELSERDGRIVVVAPLDGSPAKASGLKAGDAISGIDGEPTVDLSLVEAVLKIRGDAGTDVTLTVNRERKVEDGEDVLDIKIKRGKITLDSVTWEDKENGIAYIRISRFGEDTVSEWDKVVSEIIRVMPNLSDIVLDVRGNPGGFLQASVSISSEFVEGGNVLIQELADGTKVPIKANRVGRLRSSDIDVFVLIDKGSASASEIVAGALKSRRNATLVGTQSFGKGTIQDAKDLEGGSGLHVTIAKWLTPDSEWVHNKGLTPDIEVENNPDEPDIDEQLLKAIELAKEE